MSLENTTEVCQKAARICMKVLEQNTTPEGFVAGGKLFRANWVRDSSFALHGASRIGNFEEVEKNLNIYGKYQRLDGAIPNRIERNLHVGDIINTWPLNIKFAEPIARFRSSQPWAGDTVDTSALYVISAGEYRKTSRGEKWWINNFETLKKAGSWLKNKIDRTGLVKEGLVAGWKDSHLMRGYVGYTNVCAWKAFNELSWKDDAESLKKSINENFWDDDKKYFIAAFKNTPQFTAEMN